MSYSIRAKDEFKRGSTNGSLWVPLEELRPQRLYAITYSPETQPSDCSDRSLCTYHFTECATWSKLSGVVYTLLPEFGENNRLHYHGLIAFRSGMDYVRFKDYFKNVHIVLKKIFYAPDWLKYITKQWTHLKNVFRVSFTNRPDLLNEWYEYKCYLIADIMDDPN